MDKMVLRRSSVSDSVAFNLSNPESSCYDASLSIDDKKRKLKEELYFSRINRRLALHNRIHELDTNPFYNM